MTEATQSFSKSAYSVAIFGFTATEKVVLGSIFGLSARREPHFSAAAPADTEAPDIYLVDADDLFAVEEFKKQNPGRKSPAILIGSNDRGLGWPLLARPLQWTRLFKAFDLAIESQMGVEQTQQMPVIPRTPTPGSTATAAPQSTTAPAPALTAAPTPSRGTMYARTQPTAAAAPPVVPPKPAAPAVQAGWALVVDDNATVREFMKAKLAPFKINVEFAESGEEAIGKTANRQYNCVFLDVVMPGMDGYQVCKLIKARKAILRTAVVMLTSKGSPFDRIRGSMAGCDAYLTKPVDENKLLETIAKYLPLA